MRYITPKQLARAIAVSEASIKRWCDRGNIPTTRTAGGHRRIPLEGAVSFIRQGDYELVHPELLGLPVSSGRKELPLRRARESLTEALLAGDEPVCRQLVFDLYLSGRRLAEIFDSVIAEAFTAIGRAWECRDAEVYQERRGCTICGRILAELRSALPFPPVKAPLALGGTPQHDHYALPTAMVELVLRENGWRAVSLGTNLPLETFRAAVETHQPRLLWLSISHLENLEEFAPRFEEFARWCRGRTTLVLGGRALTSEVRGRLEFAPYCENLRHLESLAESLQPAA